MQFILKSRSFLLEFADHRTAISVLGILQVYHRLNFQNQGKDCGLELSVTATEEA